MEVNKEKIKQNLLDLLDFEYIFGNEDIETKKVISNYIDSFVEQLIDLDQKTFEFYSEVEIFILRKRVGIMDNGIVQTLSKVGNETGISIDRVRQRLETLFRKIRGIALPEAIRKSKMKEDSNDELLNANIRTFNLSTRACNALQRGNLKTIKDIISCSIDEIKQLRNLGSESAKEIIDFIHKNNFRFKDDYEMTDNRQNDKIREDFLSILKGKNSYNFNYFIDNNDALIKKEIYSKIDIIVSDLLNKEKSKVSILDDKETTILRSKLGLIRDGIKENNDEIGKRLNISSDEVKEMYSNICDKMYKDVIPKIIRDYKIKDIKSKEELLNRDIEILSFTSRTYNCLKREGINTINDLTNCTINRIKQVRNISEICVNEITKILNSLGLSLKGENINKDNTLLNKYKELLIQKQELENKNNELNNEINDKLDYLNNKKTL